MGLYFLDIGSSRVLWGIIPEEGFPSISAYPYSRLLSKDARDGIAVEVVRSFSDFSSRFPQRDRDVYVLAGIGDIVDFAAFKEARVLSSRTRQPVKRRHIDAMHFNILKRIIKEDRLYLYSKLGSIDVDGVDYGSFWSDKSVLAHTVALNEYVFFMDKKDYIWLKDSLSRLKLRLRRILPREVLISQEAFSRKELFDGAIYIDIGFQQTVVIFWNKMRIQQIKVFPYGAKDITSSIMKEFGLPFGVAEELKLKALDLDLRGIDSLRVNFNDKIFEVSGARLSQIMLDCVSSILETVKREVFSWNSSLDDCVIGLTGGVCMMGGVVELCDRIFSLSSKMLFCKNQSCVNARPNLSSYSLIGSSLWQYWDRGDKDGPSFRERLRLWLQDIVTLF